MVRTLAAMLCAVMAYFAVITEAAAVPSFSRKYGTSCQTCHTHFSVLNPFGEAFRRNGYLFPSSQGSVDSDVAKEETVAMGQPEDRGAFPHAVWPGRISQALPLAAMVNLSLPYALPNSDLKKANGNSLTWDNAVGPVMLYAAGSITDSLTYYTKVSILQTGGVSLGPAYLLFNDLIGPKHLVNVWVGRLVAPQLTSHVSSGAYLADKAFPLVSAAGLFNGNQSLILGQGPSNGVELNGIAWHRMGYSLGWLASTTQAGLKAPNAQDFYARLGTKLGGMSLDGEGGPKETAQDVVRPWAETAITLDVFAYRGMTVVDNFTNAPQLTPQENEVRAVGMAARAQLGSLSANVILQHQYHHSPYAGTDPRPASYPDQPVALPGVPDRKSGKAAIGAGELAYVVYPWLVPAVRVEHTRLDSNWGSANFTRFMPGVSLLLRSNIRLYVYADMQRAARLPPQAPAYPGSWAAAGGTAVPPTVVGRKSSVEAIVAKMAWAF